MAVVYVPRSDTLEEFRQKFNHLSEYFGDSSGVLGDSPLVTVVEFLLSLQTELGDIAQLPSDPPVTSLVEAINSLVLPFYNSSGVTKNIPLRIA